MGRDRYGGCTGRSGRVYMTTKGSSYDICIVGGGASGLTAAITALGEAPGLRVVIIEKNDVPGRKLRSTGNGRCNITNTGADGYLHVLAFFRNIGITTRIYENGLVYPYSESAADVADLLAERAAASGCEILTGAAVTGITCDEEGFLISFEKKDEGITCDNSITARRIVMACGGKAGARFGTTGDGYNICKDLGHSIVKPIPVLTQVECDNDDCERLSGIRARGRASLFREGKLIFEEYGEIQFTRYGLSGIAIFNMTRFMRLVDGGRFTDYAIDIDLYPEDDIRGLLRDRREQAAKDDSDEMCRTILRTVLKGELAGYVLDRSNVSCHSNIQDMSDEDIERIAANVHALRFRPTGLKGWDHAQCTSGGVSLDEIDDITCESKVVTGLFITGELADYDGPCGGYNLTNAWMTGMSAGRAAAK